MNSYPIIVLEALVVLVAIALRCPIQGPADRDVRRLWLRWSGSWRRNVDIVSAPGDQWPDPDTGHIAALVSRLVDAYGLLTDESFNERGAQEQSEEYPEPADPWCVRRTLMVDAGRSQCASP